MLRFVALAWDQSDAGQAGIAHALSHRIMTYRDHNAEPIWLRALATPGLIVYLSESEGRTSESCHAGESAVVLGTVFEPLGDLLQPAVRSKTFTENEFQRAVKTGCQSLISSCWGTYVAFAYDRMHGKSHVLRDPTGGLPCFQATVQGIQLFFSAIEDCVRLGLLTCSINWEYMAARVVYVFLHTRDTAIREVSEVLAGEHLEICGGGVKRSFAWNPFEVAAVAPYDDPASAAAELRSVATACVAAWASRHPRLMLTLSGGLDSSIVAGCLHAAARETDVTCVTYHSAGCDGDERFYARLVAQHTGYALFEWQRDVSARIEDMLKIELSAAPSIYVQTIQTSRREAQFAQSIGASAIAGGGGGDQLFFQNAILGAADFLHLEGVSRKLFTVALDAAILRRCSVWHVLREAIAHRLSASKANPRGTAFKIRKLVSDDTMERVRNADPIQHPLFRSSLRVPPGKLFHAYSLSIPQDYYDPLGLPQGPMHVHPLISQPLVELCLRMPTYLMITGGRDRAIARRAFQGMVPREILRRRSKGGIEEHTQAILMRNIETARSLLLDGYLIKVGLLDRKRVEEVLSGRPTRVVGAMGEIFDHLSVEAWLRRWKSAAPESFGSSAHTIGDIRTEAEAHLMAV